MLWTPRRAQRRRRDRRRLQR